MGGGRSTESAKTGSVSLTCFKRVASRLAPTGHQPCTSTAHSPSPCRRALGARKVVSYWPHVQANKAVKKTAEFKRSITSLYQHCWKINLRSLVERYERGGAWMDFGDTIGR